MPDPLIFQTRSFDKYGTVKKIELFQQWDQSIHHPVDFHSTIQSNLVRMSLSLSSSKVAGMTTIRSSPRQSGSAAAAEVAPSEPAAPVVTRYEQVGLQSI